MTVQLMDYFGFVDSASELQASASCRVNYRNGDRFEFHSSDGSGGFLHETVRLSDQALLLVTDGTPARDQ